jgi:hypothetical protein
MLNKYIQNNESDINSNESNSVDCLLSSSPSPSHLIIQDKRCKEIQHELNQQGVCDFVIDLFMSDTSNKIFKENILLGIALLEGGNSEVQVSGFALILMTSFFYCCASDS